MKTLEEKLTHLSILYTVAASIGATTSSDEVIRIVLDEAIEFLKAELGVILLFDREKNVFFIKEKIGLKKEGIVKPDEWLIKEIVNKEKPIITSKETSIFLPYKPKTVIAFPIRVKNDIRAILLLGKINPLKISKEEKWILTIMVNRLGVALETSGLYRELKEVKDELIEKEKLATLAQIAQEAAHEIRNPLNVIKAGMYLLDKRFKSDAWFKEKIHRMEEAANRVEKYIEELLGLSRLPIFEIKDMDINKIIDDALVEFGIDRLFGINVVKNLEKIPIIKGDPDRLRDGLINIIRNSYEAMNGKGRIEFTTKPSDGRVQIEVFDTGCGIREEYIKDIFNPFFTTKKKGTGLGLAIVKRIIDAHKGEIKIESKEGVGTKFIIFLPANA
ncbi:MAG: ATP-binding protein [bacterium]